MTGTVALLLWVILVLAAAVANLMIAVFATNPSARHVIGLNDLVGPDAVASGWPAPPPQSWPAPDHIDSAWSIAHRETYAQSGGGEPPTYWMLYDEFGWPWPVLDRVQVAWPSDHAAWFTAPDTGLRLVPLGAVATPLVGGTLLWLVIVVPLLVARALRRRRRVARGQCLDCGYPVRGIDTCPECGTPASVKPRPA